MTTVGPNHLTKRTLAIAEATALDQTAMAAADAGQVSA